MYYEVFPFGKYKGMRIEEIPSTYLVYSLEKFELPKELQSHIYFTILGRLKAFSTLKRLIVASGESQAIEDLETLTRGYEQL